MACYIDGLTIDPEKVILKINSEEIIAKSAKPVCDTNQSFQAISDMSEKGVHNICLCQNNQSLTDAKTNPIPLNNIWYCYDLIFDTEVPSPDAKFSISISDIQINGSFHDSIDIDFEKEEWTSFF